MPVYQRKPREVIAFQLKEGMEWGEVPAWALPFLIFSDSRDGKEWMARTLQGGVRVDAGDYIVLGKNKDEVYPCKPDIFEADNEYVREFLFDDSLSEVVLVCEDERIVATDIFQTLSKLGYLVVGPFSSLEEILTFFESFPYYIDKVGLALVDIQLANNTSGIDVARYLKGYGIPSVFLTAFSDQQTKEEAASVDPFGYVLKPFTDATLKEALENAFSKLRQTDGSKS